MTSPTLKRSLSRSKSAHEAQMVIESTNFAALEARNAVYSSEEEPYPESLTKADVKTD